MREFHKKMKTAVSDYRPNKEEIRRATKEETVLISSFEKGEPRIFSAVRAVATAATVFLLAIGIMAGAVLIENTKKPLTGPGDGGTTAPTTDEATTSPETDRVGENAVPLSYRIDTETPLMEDPTPWETVREKILNGDIITDTEREYITASDLKNVTTQAFYDQTGYEIFRPTYSLYGIYLYDGEGVYTVSSDYHVGCPVVLRHGETYGMLMASAWGSGIIRSQVFYYDFVTKSTVTLFINQWDQDINGINADHELPYTLPNSYWMLSVEPVYHENGDISVRVFDMVSAPDLEDVFLVAKYKSVWIGTLRYSAENKTWDYEPKETPEPVTTDTVEDVVTEPPMTEEPLVYTDSKVYVGYCSDEVGVEKLWELSVSRRDESDYPAYLFRDRASLMSFYRDTEEYLFYGNVAMDSICFGDLTAIYNDDFFADKTLVIVYVPMKYDSYSVTAESVSLNGGILTVSVNKGDRGDEMLSGYFALIEIEGGLEGLHEICVEDVSENRNVADLIPETAHPEPLPSVDVTLIENKPVENITVSYSIDSSIDRSYSSAQKTALVVDFLNGLAILDTTEEPPAKDGRTLEIVVKYTDGTSVVLYQFDEYLRIDGGALYKLLDYNDVAALEKFLYYTKSDTNN